MFQTVRHRNGLRAIRLRLAHPAPAANVHRPIPRRLAIVLFVCLIVPVMVLCAELLMSMTRGFFA